MGKSAKEENQYPALFGLLKRRLSEDGEWTLEVEWKRVFAVLAVLVALLWACWVGFVFAFFKYARGFEEMTVFDALKYPANAALIREKTGDYTAELAREYMQKGDWENAFVSLHLAHARNPKNAQTARKLAEFYVAGFGKPETAVHILEQTLFFAKKDSDFVKTYALLLAQLGEDEKLAAALRKLLAHSDERALTVNLAFTLSKLYAAHGEYAKSNECVRKYGLADTLDGMEILARNDWAQGWEAEALKTLETALNKKTSQSKFGIYATLVELFCERGEYVRARTFSLMCVAENPASVAPRLQHAEVLEKLGETDSARGLLNSLANSNLSDERACLQIGEFAAKRGDTKTAKLLFENAVFKNFSPADFGLVVLEALYKSGECENALGYAQTLKKDSAKYTDAQRARLAAFEALSAYAAQSGLEGDSALRTLEKTAPAPLLTETARELAKIGRAAEAAQIAETAATRDTRDASALLEYIDRKAALGDFADTECAAHRLARLRLPPLPKLRKTISVLAKADSPEAKRARAVLETVVRGNSGIFESGDKTPNNN